MPRTQQFRPRTFILIPPTRRIQPLITVPPTAGQWFTGRQSISAGAGLTGVRTDAGTRVTVMVILQAMVAMGIGPVRFRPLQAAGKRVPLPRILVAGGVLAIRADGREAGRVRRSRLPNRAARRKHCGAVQVGLAQNTQTRRLSSISRISLALARACRMVRG